MLPIQKKKNKNEKKKPKRKKTQHKTKENKTKSQRYSVPEQDGTQHMILCRVICGESCQGKDEYNKQIPNKPNVHHSYETMVDNLNDPTIYVVAKDNQAFPEFLISFKDTYQQQFLLNNPNYSNVNVNTGVSVVSQPSQIPQQQRNENTGCVIA